MIGDRVDNDIIPAREMGMKTVRVRQGMWKYRETCNEDEQADYEVDDLRRVIRVRNYWTCTQRPECSYDDRYIHSSSSNDRCPAHSFVSKKNIFIKSRRYFFFLR